MLEHLASSCNQQGEIARNRDNQQEIITIADFGWIAGIIEGEGTVSLDVKKKTWNGWKGVGVDFCVCITNTDAGIISRAKWIIESLGYSTYICERSFGSMYKNVLVLHVTKMKNILSFLTKIRPYLFGEKKRRADLIVQFISRRLDRKGSRSAKKGTSWYDETDWNIVRKFYEECGKKMNAKVREILNEHTPSPKGMICSELNGDIKKQAEMTCSVT